MKYTPERITDLKDNEVFTFGSNEAGIHGAGAARLAMDKFGAKYGKGYGLMGKSFAIPTKDKNIETLALSKISMYIDSFVLFAKDHPELTFYVTKIGCGLAGYSEKDIAPLFHPTNSLPNNIILPKEFYETT